MDKEVMDTKKVFSRLGLGLFLTLIATVASQNLVAILILKLAPAFMESPWYIWTLAGLPLYLVGLPVFYLATKGIPEREKQAPKAMSFKELMIMFVICMAAAYIFNLVGASINQLIGLIKGQAIINPLEDVLEGTNVISTIIFAGILTPIVEETIFRGIMLKKLRIYGDGLAIWVTALAFGLFHGNLSQFFYALVLGLFLGYVVVRTNRIRYSIILHMLINIVGSVIMPGLVLSQNPLLMGVASLAMMALIILGIVFYRRYVKEVTLEAGEIEIEAAGKMRKVYFNLGMILFYSACAVMFVTTIIS